MKSIRLSWKRYRPIIFSLAIGCVAGLLWMGSPQTKQYRLLTLTFLGLAALGIVFEVFQRRSVAGHEPVDTNVQMPVAPALTLGNSDVDTLLQAEQLRHPETISLPLVIKPNPRNAIPLWMGLVAIVGLVDFVITFHIRGAGLVIAGAVTVVLTTLVLWFRVSYFSRTMLFVDEREAGLVPAFGRRKMVSRKAIRDIALRRVSYGKSAMHRLIVVGKDGRALLAMNAEGYSAADAALFAAALQVPVNATWQSITATKLSREIPGAVSGVYRYAVVFGAVLAIVLFVVFLILALATGHYSPGT